MRNDLIQQKVLFSSQECEYLKSLFNDTDFKRSMVSSRNEFGSYSDNRTSDGIVLPFSVDKKNILSTKLNELEIFGNPYTFSILRYDVGQEFKKHIDNIGPTSQRYEKRFKTIVIQLSSETKYEGGELIINNNGSEVVASKELGNTIVFHSSLEHWVEKVTNGRRYSIVFWVEKEHLNINNTLI